MTRDTPPEQIEYVVIEKKSRPIYRRPGCMLGLLAWFLFMLTPIFLFVLAIQGDITINHRGDIPDKRRHPFLQVKLIMEVDYRGVSITRSTIHRNSSDGLCMENNVDFILWQGDGEPATYCQCYERDSPDSDWTSIGVTDGDCE